MIKKIMQNKLRALRSKIGTLYFKQWQVKNENNDNNKNNVIHENLINHQILHKARMRKC